LLLAHDQALHARARGGAGGSDAINSTNDDDTPKKKHYATAAAAARAAAAGGGGGVPSLSHASPPSVLHAHHQQHAHHAHSAAQQHHDHGHNGAHDDHDDHGRGYSKRPRIVSGARRGWRSWLSFRALDREILANALVCAGASMSDPLMSMVDSYYAGGSACVCARVRACARACVRACVRACAPRQHGMAWGRGHSLAWRPAWLGRQGTTRALPGAAVARRRRRVCAGKLGTNALAALGSNGALYSVLYFLCFTALAVLCTQVCACVCVCVCVGCWCVCACVCVRACMCVRAALVFV
jgi:hypothetical protein